jgi:hypothetical protein
MYCTRLIAILYARLILPLGNDVKYGCHEILTCFRMIITHSTTFSDGRFCLSTFSFLYLYHSCDILFFFYRFFCSESLLEITQRLRPRLRRLKNYISETELFTYCYKLYIKNYNSFTQVECSAIDRNSHIQALKIVSCRSTRFLFLTLNLDVGMHPSPTQKIFDICFML